MGGLVMGKRKPSTEQELEEIAVEDEQAIVSKVKRKQKFQHVVESGSENISSGKLKKKKQKEKKKLRSEARQDEQYLHADLSSRGSELNTQSSSEQEQVQLHGNALLDITEHEGALYTGTEDGKNSAISFGKSNESRDDDFAVDNISEKAKGGDSRKKKMKKKRDKWGQVMSNTQDTFGDDELLETAELAINEHVNVVSGTKSEMPVEYDNKTVCAGGMPYDTSEEDIWEFFKSCGAIANVVCMKFADTQRFKGLAFITFKTVLAATKALSLDGADMGGRLIKIERARAGGKVHRPPPKREPGSLSVYIGNLDWDVQKADIKRFFKGCAIDDVRLAVDKGTGNFRGYGHVDFSDEKSLEKAVKMDQKQLFGRSVKISYAVSKGSKG